MNKTEFMSIIRSAKQSHKRWVENAHSLIEGIPLDKSQVPVNSTDCVFGKWYYGDGQALKPMVSFREIEEHHDALHHTYREIFVLLFEEKERSISFFSRLFGRSHKSSVRNQSLAREKFSVLEQQSKTIIYKLDELEKIVSGMNENQINSYINKE